MLAGALKKKKKNVSETSKKDLETAGLPICFLKSLFSWCGVLYDGVDFLLCRAIRISPACQGLLEDGITLLHCASVRISETWYLVLFSMNANC